MSGVSVSSSWSARAAVGRDDRVEAAHRQVGADQVDDVRVVLHDQGPGAARAVGHAGARLVGKRFTRHARVPPTDRAGLVHAACTSRAARAGQAARGGEAVRSCVRGCLPRGGAMGGPSPRPRFPARAGRVGRAGRSGRVAGPAGPVPPAPAACLASAASPRASTGRRISKLVPSPVPLSRMCPPCASTIPCAIDSPSPAPALAECPRRFGSNGAAARSGGSPRPSSRHADHDLAIPAGPAVDAHPRPGRVVAERVVEQVHEHLLEAVVVGPDGGSAGWQVTSTIDARRLGQAGDRRLEHQRDLAPVVLQPQDRGLDRGEVEQVVDESAQPRRLGCDPAQEPVLGVAVPGHIGLQQAGRVTADRGQRRAQFVAQARQEAPLELL